MASVRCTVTLLKDRNRKVDIQINKEKDGTRRWSLIKSSGGSLSLPALKGGWETIHGDVLSLSEHNSQRKHKDLVMLVVWNVKPDFLDDIVNNGSTIVSDEAGLYNDNPSETDVSVKLARMN